MEQKKSRNLPGQKIMQPLKTKHSHATSRDNKNHANSQDKKITQHLGTKKITQPLETKKLDQETWLCRTHLVTFYLNVDYFRPYKNHVQPGYKGNATELMVNLFKDHLGPFAAIEDHLRPFKTILNILGPFYTYNLNLLVLSP